MQRPLSRHPLVARGQTSTGVFRLHGGSAAALVGQRAACRAVAALACGRLGAVGLRDQAAQPHQLALSELVPRNLRSFLLQRDGRFASFGARHVVYDRQLADLDQRIWGLQPAVWLTRIQTPVFTELFAVGLYLFVPAVLLVAFLLWYRRRIADFQYYAFLIALGYLVSYLGYVLWPARGPRFLLKALEHMPLHGLWLFEGMQSTLDKLESVAYDAFPSGHTELTILAWWSSQGCVETVVRRVFWLHSEHHFCYSLSSIPLYG